MPLREYECPRCGYFFRQWDHSGKLPVPICLVCEKPVHLLISKCNFRLRGLGWASDGYSKDIDDCERFWARDGQPVGDHVEGCTQFQQKKKTDLVNQLEKMV